MKKKFIAIGIVAVMLIVMLCFAVPASAAADVGVAESITAETANPAVMSSEALIIEQTAPAPAPAPTGEAPMWIALGASLVTLAVVSTRRLLQKILSKIWGVSFRGLSGGPLSATGTGGPNKFILAGWPK